MGTIRDRSIGTGTTVNIRPDAGKLSTGSIVLPTVSKPSEVVVSIGEQTLTADAAETDEGLRITFTQRIVVPAGSDLRISVS